MSELRVATIEPEGATTTLTLGASGDTVTSSADAIKANTFKDAGGNTLWTSNGSGTLSSVNSALAPSIGYKLLQTTTTSGTPSEITFTTGIDSTYNEYLFVWHNMIQTYVNAYFDFQCSTDGGSNYNTTMTTSYFYAEHNWTDTSGNVGYHTGEDQGQGTAYQTVAYNLGPNQTEGMAGRLRLFNPGSTTYVKNFMSEVIMITDNDYVWVPFVNGYFNTTSAIDAISFKLVNGTFYNGGKFYMYGVT